MIYVSEDLDMDFKIGDCVKVNDGVPDPDDNGLDMSGWQGRITQIEPTYIMFAWDSISLQAMGKKLIDQYESDGFDWKEMGLEADEISLAEPRDTLKDVAKTVEEFSKDQVYLYLDNGAEIQEILQGLDPKNTSKLEQRWHKHFGKTLKLPVEAEVFHGDYHGEFCMGSEVTILSLEIIDDIRGIIARVKSKEDGTGYVPLCNLEVLDSKLEGHTLISDYADWFTNARAG